MIFIMVKIRFLRLRSRFFDDRGNFLFSLVLFKIWVAVFEIEGVLRSSSF